MDVLTLVGVGIWCFLVALAGGLVGLVLGNIRLPVLLFAAASPAAAGGANIAVSGLAAAAASITHIRARRVDWRLVAWMLPPSVLGAIGGGAAASYVPADALRILIGSALLLFGIDLLRPRRSGPIPSGSGGPSAGWYRLDVAGGRGSGLRPRCADWLAADGTSVAGEPLASRGRNPPHRGHRRDSAGRGVTPQPGCSRSIVGIENQPVHKSNLPLLTA